MFKMYSAGHTEYGVALSNVLGAPISKNETMCPEIEKVLQAVSLAADLYGVKRWRLFGCLKCALQAK